VQPPVGKFIIINIEFPKLITFAGSFMSPVKKHLAVNKPVIHSRSINYHSNGSGRDSYIVYSHSFILIFI